MPELFELLVEDNPELILLLDQSQTSEDYAVLMISIRLKDRALPVMWRVIETQGAIGFKEQEGLVRSVAKWIPKGAKVKFMGDRFYGTPSLIALCQELKFGYRFRLKSNLTLQHAGGELNSGELLKLKLHALEEVELGKSGVKTNIGVIHDAGHDEPWIIAMDEKPLRSKMLDYGKRWGIEAMFSDLKTRGLRVQETQLRAAERIERLLLVLTIAVMWAVSTGYLETHAPRSKKTLEITDFRFQTRLANIEKCNVFY